jgi:hypothetical protein
VVRWSAETVPRLGQVVTVRSGHRPRTGFVSAFVVCEGWLGFVIDDDDPVTGGLYYGIDIELWHARVYDVDDDTVRRLRERW